MPNVRIDMLRSIDLFSSMTDEELREVSGMLSIREFPRNAVVLRAEDTNTYMYVILSGKAKVVQATEEGKEIILAIHRENEFFGEVSLLDGKTSPATVVATENSVVAIISREDYHALLATQHKLVTQLLQVFCTRFRDCLEQIQTLSEKSAAQRVRMLLLRLSHGYGEETPAGIRLRIRLTHQDVADMAGLTRETVTKVIDQMKRDGEISLLPDRSIRLNHRFLDKERED